MKYIDAEKLVAEIERRQEQLRICCGDPVFSGKEKKDMIVAYEELDRLRAIITSLQQEQQDENKLPSKRTRVNYAICKLQSFKPLREAIVLDNYAYEGSKCYRENLLNYIHAIPENRLTEIRSYLKEKGWWPYDDDADWLEQEQPEADYNKFEKLFDDFCERNKGHHITSHDACMWFWELGLNTRKEE